MTKKDIIILKGEVDGRWMSKNSESIEFRNNDIYTSNGHKIGTYKATKDYLFIKFDDSNESDVYLYEIKGNKMTLENLDRNYKYKDIFYSID